MDIKNYLVMSRLVVLAKRPDDAHSQVSPLYNSKTSLTGEVGTVRFLPILKLVLFILRIRFISYKETNLQKKCVIKSIYTYTVYNKLADSLTSIKIGLSCTAYIPLMNDCECQL